MEKESKTQLEIDLLFLHIKENNKAGLDYLYDQFGGMLYGFAIKSVGLPEYAEEIVETTFVKVWHYNKLYKLQETSFQVWIIINLISTIEEFFDSKNIAFVLKFDEFPEFRFEFK